MASRVVPIVLVLAAFVVVMLGAPSPAGADLDADIAKADKRLVSHLMAVTKWAAGKRINGFRHDVFRLILQVDPDHKRARGVLGYKRQGRDGPWVRKKEYKEPANWGTGFLAKAKERLQGGLERWRDDLFDALEADPAPEAERHDLVLERLLDLLPQDAAVRERCGHVQHEGRWVLPETAAALPRRAELRALAPALAREKARQAVVDPEPIGNGWKSAWKTKSRRVYGAIRIQETRSIITAMDVADAVCTKILGPSKKVRGPKQTIILTSRKEARRIVAREPEWRSALKDVEHVRGLILPTGEYLVYRSDAKNRLLGPVRQVVDSGLDRRFRGKARGWISEGIGQRITWYVTGHHGPNFVSLNRTERLTGTEETVELPDDPRAWPAAAAAVLAHEGGARIAALLTKRLNAMTAADVLAAYGLAAYLMEARPESFLRFTEATAKGHDAQAIIRETLGADHAAMLARRLRRWLLEV